MKTPLLKNAIRGLTRFEVLIVIAVLFILIALLLPNLAYRNHRSPKIGCVNDLKQVGLAFRVWEGDNNDKFPMSVSVTNDGTMELVESGVVWRHFEVMSNELNTPKILFCPSETDSRRQQANTFQSYAPLGGPGMVLLSGETNVSYFIGVDATDVNPTMFLAGDRNLTVKGVALSPGLHSVGTNELVGWTRELHVNQGNVAMVDGSVQSFTQSGLQQALRSTGVATNRLAVP